MNIFVLDSEPALAAQMQCDQHVVKMVLESAQMLSTAYHMRTGQRGPYAPAFQKHPCTLWVAESAGNFAWLVAHGSALAHEYTFRFGKQHKAFEVISWCGARFSDISFPRSELMPFALAMPEVYRDTSDPVQSYRRYYLGDKKKFARWGKARAAPAWWTPEANK